MPWNFGGIVPPVCTPLTEDCEVDVASLERLVQFLLDAGVHGLFMLGSTSESALLTDSQREVVLDVAVRTVAGHVPVLAGVIEPGTTQTIARATTAERVGVDGLVATGPFYIRPSQDEVVCHFKAIRNSVGIPVFAYDVPPNVQTKLERSILAVLARAGVISGVKDSSGDEANFRGVVLDSREIEGCSVFTGSELLVDAALSMGAHGAVPRLGNVDSAGYVRIYESVRADDLEAARHEQERLYRLFRITDQAKGKATGRTASALGAFKTALYLRGIISTNVTGRPLTRLGCDDVASIRHTLLEGGLL